MPDFAIAALLAAAATCGLAGGYSHPAALTAFLAVLNLIALARWRRREDCLAWAMGASLGNITELAADAAGLWIHADRAVWGIAPAYILLCYPLLWLAGPRMLDRLAGPRRVCSRRDAWLALTIWAAHTALCCGTGASNTRLAAISLAALGALLLPSRSRADIVYACAGAGLGMVWEIPCTWSGAWRFPSPDFAGLIPVWLPIAYAVFFVSLNRVRCFWLESYATGPEARTIPSERDFHTYPLEEA